MRLALIANPGSGGDVPASSLRARLEAHGAEVVLCEAGWRRDAETVERAREADRIVAAGGDGIVGPCAALAGDLGLPLAVVPVGTANDFARAQELPTDVEAACRLAAGGRRRRALELALMAAGGEDPRPFVNAASAGLSPLAAQRARPLKRVLGPAAYAVGAAAAGVLGKPLSCTLRVDDRVVFGGRAWQVTVAATGAFGGGAQIGGADPQDGRLDVVAVPAGRRLGLLGHAIAMRRGTLAGQDGVAHTRGDAVAVDLDAPSPFNVDGERVACPAGQVRFWAEEAAYELIVG